MATIQRLGMDISVKATGATQVEKLAVALEHLKSVSLSGLTSKINSLEKMMQPFKNMDAAKGINKFANSLNKLAGANLTNLAGNIQNMASALRPLTNEMIRGAGAAQSYATVIQKMSAKTITSGNAMKKASGSFNIFSGAWQKMIIGFYAASKVKQIMSGWVTEANAYIENLNLFTVAMGEYTEQAVAYANQVGDTLGIDPSQWMRQQGIIMDMSRSFGVATDTAYKMSRALTQIAYDFSSLYNLDIDTSMKKIQSALAGEIEPVRRVGKDLSVARLQLEAEKQLADAMADTNLQAEASRIGMNVNISQLAQADKAMLRTIALLRQSGSAMGDLARTINSPANQLRIFNAQVVQMKRALGYILLPALQMILPYLIAAAKVIRLVAEGIATLFGFKMPEFNYDSLAGNLALGATDSGTIADNMDSAAKSAKKINSYRAGFDELNVVSKPEASTGGSGGGGTGGGGGGFAGSGILEAEIERLSKIYDEQFLANVDDKVTRIVGNMLEWLGLGKLITDETGKLSIKMNDIDSWSDFFKTRLGEILIIVGAIGTAMLAWKIAGGIYAFFTAEFTKVVIATAALWLHTIALTANNVALGILNGTYFLAIGTWINATVAKVANTVSTIANTVATTANNIAVGILTGSIFKNTAAWIAGKVQILASTVALIAHNVATKAITAATIIWSGVTKAVTAAQWLLNAALTANPIGLVIAAVALLVAGFILLYNKSETFREAIQGIAKWFKDTFMPIIKAVVGWFEDLADWIDKIFGDGNKKLTVDVNGSENIGGTKPITRFATGGFPEDGLFMANSNEMVGSFRTPSGTRAAVANNDQITEGISSRVYDAVYRAVTDASGRGGEPDIVVAIDGEAVFRANRKASTKKGQPILQTEYAR